MCSSYHSSSHTACRCQKLLMSYSKSDPAFQKVLHYLYLLQLGRLFKCQSIMCFNALQQPIGNHMLLAKFHSYIPYFLQGQGLHKLLSKPQNACKDSVIAAVSCTIGVNVRPSMKARAAITKSSWISSLWHTAAQLCKGAPPTLVWQCARIHSLRSVVVQVPHDNPAQALVLAKKVTVMVYERARKLFGDLSPVLVPPRYTFPPYQCVLQAFVPLCSLFCLCAFACKVSDVSDIDPTSTPATQAVSFAMIVKSPAAHNIHKSRLQECMYSSL